jgi:hypothetical protein
MHRLIVAIAFAVASTPTLSEKSRIVLYGACISGKGTQYAIDQSRARKLPTWQSPAASEPPLSIKTAVAAAEKHVSRALGGKKPAPVSSVRLARTFATEPIVWYYVVDFEEPMASNPLVRRSIATVLLDGTTVEPTEEKCEMDSRASPSLPR